MRNNKKYLSFVIFIFTLILISISVKSSNKDNIYGVLFSNFEEKSKLNLYKNNEIIESYDLDVGALVKVEQKNNHEYLFYFGNELVEFNSKTDAYNILEVVGGVDTVYFDEQSDKYLANINVGVLEDGYDSKFGYLEDNVFYNSQNTLIHSAISRNNKIYLFTREIQDTYGNMSNKKYIEIYTNDGILIEKKALPIDEIDYNFNFNDGVIDKNGNILFMFYDYLVTVYTDDTITLDTIKSNFGIIKKQPQLFNFDNTIFGISENGIIFKLNENYSIEILHTIEGNDLFVDSASYFIDTNGSASLLFCVTELNLTNERVISFKEFAFDDMSIKDVLSPYNFDKEYTPNEPHLFPGILFKAK